MTFAKHKSIPAVLGKYILNIKLKLRHAPHFYFALLAYVLISLLGMIYSPLFDEDEGFFAEAARNMLQSGDFFSTWVNAEARFDKPGLYFWLECLSMQLFGISALAVRLPSFLFFLAFIFEIYKFSERHFIKIDPKEIIFIGFGMLQFQVLSKAAVVDNALNFFLCYALFNFYELYISFSNGRLIKIGCAIALGILTKGPIMLVLFFAVAGMFILYTRSFVLILKFLKPTFLLSAFLLPAVWFFVVWQRSGEALFVEFFLKHNLGRYTATMESHGGVWCYYFPVLLLSFFPFSHLVFSAFNQKFNPLVFILISWFVFVFVFFSFSKTQLPHYISYGYAPLLVLISNVKIHKKWPSYIQMYILMAVLLLLPLSIRYVYNVESVGLPFTQNEFNTVFDQTYFVVAALLFGGFVFLKRFEFKWLIFISFTSFFIFKYGLLQQGFVRQIGIKLKAQPETVYMHDHYNPSLSFYAQRSFPIKETFGENEIHFLKLSKIDTSKVALIDSGGGFALVGTR